MPDDDKRGQKQQFQRRREKEPVTSAPTMRDAEAITTEAGSPPQVLTVGAGTSVSDAASMMHTQKVGCLVVNDERGKMIGIMTERDIVTRLASDSTDPRDIPVSEIMTPGIVSCPEGTSMSEAREIMARHHVRHLPIVSDGVAVGMVSSRDAMMHQLLSDRAMKLAAEQVAMLSTCLRSLDFNEVVNMVTREVPKIFHADRSVLCLPGADSSAAGALISRNECVCSQESLLRKNNELNIPSSGELLVEKPSGDCKQSGCGRQVLAIALDLTHHDTGDQDKPSGGYLCMCGLKLTPSASENLLTYKGTLVREILNVNLSNAMLYQQVRQKSLTDELTGVGTRRLFDEKLEGECVRSARSCEPFSVAIVDIDNFKWINDRIGHAGGDQALIDLAIGMKEMMREGDVIARYGGDEFVLLLPNTQLPGAVTLLERIRTRTEAIPVGQGIRMTVSCGVVEQRGKARGPASDLIRQADLALYEAKGAGRNRVTTWRSELDEPRQTNLIESDRIRELEEQITGMSAQSREMLVQSIWGLVHALDARDVYTKNHSENVTRYAVAIAETMEIDSPEIAVIRRAAMIHDIGKIGVPDAILRKPGKLTPQERRVMEQHSLIGARILDQMRFLERELPIVRHHHERYDGLGYPDGVFGIQIPLGARILAVADSFDAITSERVYHGARSTAEAVNMMLESRGTQFDPEIVDAMVRWIERVKAERGSDGEMTAEQLLESQRGCVMVA